MLQSFLEGKQNTHRSKYGDKVWSRDWRKGHPDTVPPGDSSHIQSPNLDIIVNAKKCMLEGAWYGCLLRGPARQIQRWMLAVNQRTECRVPYREVRERTEGVEGVCNPIGSFPPFYLIVMFLNRLSDGQLKWKVLVEIGRASCRERV